MHLRSLFHTSLWWLSASSYPVTNNCCPSIVPSKRTNYINEENDWWFRDESRWVWWSLIFWYNDSVSVSLDIFTDDFNYDHVFRERSIIRNNDACDLSRSHRTCMCVCTRTRIENCLYINFFAAWACIPSKLYDNCTIARSDQSQWRYLFNKKSGFFRIPCESSTIRLPQLARLPLFNSLISSLFFLLFFFIRTYHFPSVGITRHVKRNK